MRHNEDDEGGRRPEPADFDEVDVEDVALPREVGGRQVRWVRLRCCGVRGISCLGRDKREKGAEEEGGWIHAQQSSLHGRW